MFGNLLGIGESMLKKLKFIKPYRCFAKGETFTFRKGVNLLVGDQGCGKSSLLGLLKYKSRGDCKEIEILADPTKVMAFDFEKDSLHNPRGKFRDDVCYGTQILSMWQSHGETNRDIWLVLEKESDTLILMDEPDMAMSIRSCKRLAKVFKQATERNCQVIAAVHNVSVIEEFPEVLSLEHRAWIKTEDFIKHQLTEEMIKKYDEDKPKKSSKLQKDKPKKGIWKELEKPE